MLLIVFLSISIFFAFSPPVSSFQEDPEFFEINIDRDHPEEVYKAFEEFKIKYKRKYKDAAENSFRMNNFVKTYNKVEELNKNAQEKGHSTTFAINNFSDLSTHEFRQRLSPYPPTIDPHAKTLNLKKRSKRQAEAEWEKFPSYLDLRDERLPNGDKIIGGLTDQGRCACCWGFATTVLTEAVAAHFKGSYQKLSEQELCDCATINGKTGCTGGTLDWGLDYVAEKGQSSGNIYAFDEERAFQTNQCETKRRKFPSNLLEKIRMNPHNAVYDIKYIMNHWRVPVLVQYYTADGLQHYNNGTMEGQKGCEMADKGGTAWHAGAIVGYGEESDSSGGRVGYYIVKNSWGVWGPPNDMGYFKVRSGMNWCKMEEFATTANLNDIVAKLPVE